MMHRTGGWQQTHPWLECFVPFDALDDLLPRLLDQSPPFLGDGHRVSLVADRGPRFFMFPDRSPTAMFAVLPMGIPAALRDAALAAVSRLHHMLTSAGGKRYLSGWFGTMDEAAWRRHFGARYRRMGSGEATLRSRRSAAIRSVSGGDGCSRLSAS